MSAPSTVPPPAVRCGCGRAYTAPEWAALPAYVRWVFDDGSSAVLKHCVGPGCKSTLATEEPS